MADLGDIVRGESVRYLQTRFVPSHQRKALRDIGLCRTEAMRSVTAKCDKCGAPYRLLCSCRNRSCPLCQSEARQKWLEARLDEILPCEYLHVVFNTPKELDVLGRYCPEEFYDAVMRASGQAVIEVGWSELRARMGCHAHLQTWGQSMAYHVHVHCVVPCGGFSEDGSRWISFAPRDLPRKALASRFRALLCKGIRALARQGQLDPLPVTVSVEQILARVTTREWRVYAKPPFGGAEKLFEYLSRYVYRVAIANDRIESYENGKVTFRWRDYRHGNEEKSCTLEGQEFLRRYVMHVPPRGFVRIRSYGFLGNRNRKRNLEQARQLIGQAGEPRMREPYKPLRLCPGPRSVVERPITPDSRALRFVRAELVGQACGDDRYFAHTVRSAVQLLPAPDKPLLRCPAAEPPTEPRSCTASRRAHSRPPSNAFVGAAPAAPRRFSRVKAACR